MKSIATALFQANAHQTATSDEVVFPLSLSVEGGGHQAAVKDARAVFEFVAQSVEAFRPKTARLRVGDPLSAKKQLRAELALAQEGRDKVHLYFEFSLILALDEGPFWERAELIGQAIDFVQGLCGKTRDKGKLLSLHTAVLGNNEEAKAAGA